MWMASEEPDPVVQIVDADHQNVGPGGLGSIICRTDRRACCQEQPHRARAGHIWEGERHGLLLVELLNSLLLQQLVQQELNLGFVFGFCARVLQVGFNVEGVCFFFKGDSEVHVMDEPEEQYLR